MSAGKATPVQPRPDSSPGCPPLLLAGHPDPADRSGGRAAGRTPPRWADPGRPHGCVRSGGADRDGSVITSKRRAPALVRGCRTGPCPAGGVVRRRGGRRRPRMPARKRSPVPVAHCRFLSLHRVVAVVGRVAGHRFPLRIAVLLPSSGGMEWAQVRLRGVLSRRHAGGGMQAPPGGAPDG